MVQLLNAYFMRGITSLIIIRIILDYTIYIYINYGIIYDQIILEKNINHYLNKFKHILYHN